MRTNQYMVLVIVAAVVVAIISLNGKRPAENVALDVESASSEAAVGAYVEYSSNVIAQTSGTKLLFFHAPWCPQCRALEASIKSGTIPTGVTIIKVDYDSNQALRQKYGVTLQTTIVEVDDSGNKVDAFVAYDDPSLQAVVERLL